MGKDFLDRTLITQVLKSIIKKWELLKLKLLYSKGHSMSSEEVSDKVGKIFSNDSIGKGLDSRI